MADARESVDEDDYRVLLKYSDRVPVAPQDVTVVRDFDGKVIGYLIDRESLR